MEEQTHLDNKFLKYDRCVTADWLRIEQANRQNTCKKISHHQHPELISFNDALAGYTSRVYAVESKITIIIITHFNNVKLFSAIVKNR